MRPVSDALGAEVVGLNLSRPLGNATFAFVYRAFRDHLVLVFREQALSPESQIAFSRRFGPVDPYPADNAMHPYHPETLLLSTRKRAGKYVGLPDAGPMWHSHVAYKDRTALGSMLRAIEVPDYCGDTWFANMYAA